MPEQLAENIIPYKTIIFSLVSYAMHPKLDTLIEKLTPNEKPSVRFLIKVEIKRLSKPCPYVLDFRSYFGDCEPVDHQNVRHYLDEISKTLFAESLEKNNGLFSMNIFNELNAHAKQRHIETLAQEKALKELKQGQQVKISDVVKRFSLINSNLCQDPPIDVESRCGIFTYDPLGMSRKGKDEIGIPAAILDLNHNYCVIKTAYKALELSDDTDKEELASVFLWIYDHSASLELSEEIILQYSIEDSKEPKSRKYSHYRLKLNKASESKMINRLAELLSKKVQVSKTLQENQIQPLFDSVFAKGHEQFVLSQLYEQVILCQKSPSGLIPASILQTEYNEALINFFTQDEKIYPLSNILTHRYIKECLAKQDNFSCYAYVLRYDIEDANKEQFAIIWQQQLKENDVKQVLTEIFFTGNYRFIQINVRLIDAVSDAYNPSAIPDHINPLMSLLNKPIGEQIQQYLARNNYLVQISDITDINQILNLDSDSIELKEEHLPLKPPLKYRLPAKYKKSKLEKLRVKVNDFRAEDRFEYTMTIRVTKCERIACNITGITRNISSKGLLIKLAEPLSYKAGDKIYLTMELPYRKRIVSIAKQLYQIVGGSDECNLRLLIAETDTRHAASYMIREFIYQNMENLKVSGLAANQTYGLESAMRNIYAKNHIAIPFFVHQDKRQWFISSVAMNKHINIPTLKAKNIDSIDMLQALIEQEKFRNYCMSLLNKVDKNNPIESFYLIILPRNTQDKEKQMFWFNDLNQLHQQHHLFEVVEKIRLLGKPTILRIQLLKPNRIMDKYYRDELEYLSHLDANKAGEVANHLDSLLGIGEIFDHSKQVLALIDDLVNAVWTEDF